MNGEASSFSCYFKSDRKVILLDLFELKPRSKPKIKKKFTEEDDLNLLYAVNQLGTLHWGEVAKRLPGRTARQCRERWMNYVNPCISSKPWTKEEDEIIIRKLQEFGTKWHEIAKYLENRPINAIKIRWSYIEKSFRSRTIQNEVEFVQPKSQVETSTNEIQPLNSGQKIVFPNINL